ncbi:Kcns1, partial [Symbiodinium microadriaticum]
LMHYIRECRQLSHALSNEFRFINVFLFGILVIVLMLGTCLYAAEDGANGFESIPHGMWWATVTLTTVGYGDVVPQTSLGKLFAACSMLIGYGILAVPTLLSTFQTTKIQAEPDLPLTDLRSPTRTAIDLDKSEHTEFFVVQPRASDIDGWRCLKPSAGPALLEEVMVLWGRRCGVNMSNWHAYHYSFTLSVPLQQLMEESDLYVQVLACRNADSTSDFQLIFHCGRSYSPDTLDQALAEGHLRYFLPDSSAE